MFQREPYWMKDNAKEDHYIYEIQVQTGPMLSHGTTSKVQFILNGDDGETQIRWTFCAVWKSDFADPDYESSLWVLFATKWKA